MRVARRRGSKNGRNSRIQIWIRLARAKGAVRFAQGGLQKWPEQQDPNLDPDVPVGIVFQKWPEQQDPNLDLHALVEIAFQTEPEQQDPNLDLDAPVGILLPKNMCQHGQSCNQTSRFLGSGLFSHCAVGGIKPLPKRGHFSFCLYLLMHVESPPPSLKF